MFPNEDSHKYVTVQDKNAVAELRLYEQMGLTASAMAYSWSKWNGEQSADKLILQAAPHIVDEPLTEVEKHCTLLISNNGVISHNSLTLSTTDFYDFSSV